MTTAPTTTATAPAPRIPNPARLLPGVGEAIGGLLAAARAGGVPAATLELVHLRASQINGCSACVDMGGRSAQRGGESVERLLAVAAWRETPYFDAAERSALDLAEHATRLADSSDPVPDAVWDEAARHHDETALAALVLAVATTNLFNRVNATTRQGPGGW